MSGWIMILEVENSGNESLPEKSEILNELILEMENNL